MSAINDFSIQVQSIPESPTPYRIATDAAWWEAAQIAPPEVALRLVEPFVAAFHGHRLGRRLLFRGHLEGAVELSCAGCTEPFLYRHRAPLELLLEPLPTGTEPPEGGIELDPEEESLGRYAGETLNLEPAVIEALLLSWPMHPRCTEECQGLCPGCGANRNREQCSCAQTSGAHPFDGLGGLLAGRPDRRRPSN